MSNNLPEIARRNAESLIDVGDPPPGVVNTLRECADEIERLRHALHQYAVDGTDGFIARRALAKSE